MSPMLTIYLPIDTARAVRALLEDQQHIRPIAQAIKALDTAVADSLLEMTAEEMQEVGGGMHVFEY